MGQSDELCHTHAEQWGRQERTVMHHTNTILRELPCAGLMLAQWGAVAEVREVNKATCLQIQVKQATISMLE